MDEEVAVFGDAGTLVGILTVPPRAGDGAPPAIVLLNAGFIHRVGPDRLNVHLARRLAFDGFPVLRFDLSGIGDSVMRSDNLPIEKSAARETQEAMDFLTTSIGIERFVLMGLCSGADNAFRVARLDPRVVGAVCMNYQADPSDPRIRDRSHASYYKKALSSPGSWLRALKGKTDYSSVLRVVGAHLVGRFSRKRSAPAEVNRVAAELRSLTERGADVLLVYSEGDPGLDHIQYYLADEIQELVAAGKLHVEIVRGANHMFGPHRSQEHLLDAVCRWVHTIT